MLNRVDLIGRVTKDIEIRKTQNNLSLARFSLAIDRGKDQNGNVLPATFVECCAWGKRAEIIGKYALKGNIIHVSGEIRNNNYEKDGVKHYSYYVAISDFTLLPNPRKENKETVEVKQEVNQESKKGYYQPTLNGNSIGVDGFDEYADIKSDDLPFY